MKRMIALLLVLLISACKEETAHVNQPAPELAAVDKQGEPVNLSQWRGRSVYLSFWSLGCGICLEDMPRLQAFGERYKDKVEVVLVNIDIGDVSLQPTIDKYGLTVTMLHDSLGMTRDRYPIMGTPTAFLIDPDGIVRRVIAGAAPDKQMTALFDEASKGL